MRLPFTLLFFLLSSLGCSTSYLISGTHIFAAQKLPEEARERAVVPARVADTHPTEHAFVRVAALDLTQAQPLSEGQLKVRVPDRRALRIAGLTVTIIGASTLAGILGWTAPMWKGRESERMFAQLLCLGTCTVGGALLLSGLGMTLAGFARPIADVNGDSPRLIYVGR